MSDEKDTTGGSGDGGSVARQTTPSSAAACVDSQRLAAYVDGTLVPNERAGVEAHLADCEACREVVAEAARSTEALDGADADADEEPSTAPTVDIAAARRRWGRRIVWGLAAAAVVIVAVFLPWRSWVSQRPTSQKRMAALVEAVGQRRLFEPRLTGGFAYGPLAAVMRSGESDSEADLSPDIRLAAGELEKAHEAHASPRTAAGRAIGALVLGDIDTAIGLLERATQANPKIAAHWSDLAAAYLVRSSRTGDPDAVAQALAAVDLALALEPRMPEALFNRALVLDAIGRPNDAALAWSTYLSVDPTSGWAAEVKARLGRR
jgi:cellulose synthase operon protein C